MPAARPSKATLRNAVEAVLESGLTPLAVQVGSDGSFRVEVTSQMLGASVAPRAKTAETDVNPPTWQDAS